MKPSALHTLRDVLAVVLLIVAPVALGSAYVRGDFRAKPAVVQCDHPAKDQPRPYRPATRKAKAPSLKARGDAARGNFTATRPPIQHGGLTVIPE